MTSPPRSGLRLYNARGLVHVEQRGSEQQDRGEDQQRDRRSDVHALAAETVQQEDEHEAAQEERDDECGDGSERMDVVGTRELDAAS